MKNKSLRMTVAMFVITLCSFAQQTGTFTDSRDDKVYKTIKIGTQTWMAENLAYKANNGCWAYDNEAGNLKTYGYLYTWETAKSACPAGWHLPTEAEWTILNTYVSANPGASGNVAKALAATSNWSSSSNSGAIGNDLTKNNSTGFNALPGGARLTDGSFNNIEYKGFWWNSTGTAMYRTMGRTDSDLGSGSYEGGGMSVRYVKD
jgi:uncharacterized protein (TIGR02145 family)